MLRPPDTFLTTAGQPAPGTEVIYQGRKYIVHSATHSDKSNRQKLY